MMGLPSGGIPFSDHQGNYSGSNGHFQLFSIPVQKTSRRARRENLPSTPISSLSTASSSYTLMQQCNMHSPEQRIFDLVIVQICQQLGMERFRSHKIIRILSHVLHLRLRSLCLQMRYAIDEFVMKMSPENSADTMSIIRVFLTRSGELSARSHLAQHCPLQTVRPALGELIGYTAAQNSWICSLMERLASIPSDTPSQSRRMLPPEALLTLFTTLPRSFREPSSSSSSELIDSMMLEPKLSDPSPLQMKSGEQEAEEEVVGEEDANLPIVDESLKPSADLLSSFFYFRNEFDELEMDADSPLVPQNGGKSVHTLLEYDVFKCMYPSRSPTIISPVSPRSALSVHICSMLGSPAALTVPFSPAMALHADPTFVSNYFQPYPLAFSGGRTCLSLKSNGPKGRGPELSQEEVRKAASNFLFASVSSVFRRCCFPSSLLYGLALSARDYFGVGQSREVWLGELASTPGSRRRAHFCRTDGASAHTSVIHLSTASSTTASISSSLPSTEASLSIVIRTPIKPTVSVPPAQNLPPIKLIPSGSTSFIASRKNKASFIVSRQKKKKRKVKPSIRLAEPRPAPLRIVLKCAEEKPLAPIPTIRIKFPLENKVEVPKIRLKVVNPNAER